MGPTKKMSTSPHETGTMLSIGKGLHKGMYGRVEGHKKFPGKRPRIVYRVELYINVGVHGDIQMRKTTNVGRVRAEHGTVWWQELPLNIKFFSSECKPGAGNAANPIMLDKS